MHVYTVVVCAGTWSKTLQMEMLTWLTKSRFSGREARVVAAHRSRPAALLYHRCIIALCRLGRVVAHYIIYSMIPYSYT